MFFSHNGLKAQYAAGTSTPPVPVQLIIDKVKIGSGSSTNNGACISIGPISSVYDALQAANQTGELNIAIGQRALHNNLNGGYNTVIGSDAGNANTSGSDNVAIGRNAMSSNISGGTNTAIGSLSYPNHTAGSTNVAIGHKSLGGSLTATNTNVITGNCAIGGNALGRFSSGINNVAVGSDALNSASLAGDYNIAIGASALNQLNSSGGARSNNIGIGYNAQVSIATNSNQLSIQNTIYGIGMGTGSASIGIGVAAGPTSWSIYSGPNNGQIGSPTPTLGSTLRLFVNGWSGGTGFIATSDKRLKKDIKKIEKPLEKILGINGYTYNWNKDYKTFRELDDNRQAGFLAQEIEKVMPEAVVISGDGIYGLNYNAIMPLLSEGIKEQQSQIETQQAKIENLELQIAELKNKFNQLTPGDVKLKVNLIEIVPNPITGISTVSYKLDNTALQATLSIYDLQGKLLRQINLAKNTKQGQLQISKNELTAGMYIFSLVSGNEELQSKKVIVSQ